MNKLEKKGCKYQLLNMYQDASFKALDNKDYALAREIQAKVKVLMNELYNITPIKVQS